MDQKKIGKFIAECRKTKKLTQSYLAEKLGITEKSIGNWENGRNMPDVSLFKPLCNELDITINDLISGERVDENKYQEKLEENMISTINYTNKKIEKKNNFIGTILALFGIFISMVALSMFSSNTIFNPIYSILGTIILIIGINMFMKKLNIFNRIILIITFILLYAIILITIDHLGIIDFDFLFYI